MRLERAGFTLLEASIVLVVLSILMAIAVSAFEPNDLQHLQSAGDMLAADLRLTRSLAIRDNTQMSLLVMTSGWRIEHSGTGAAPELPSPPLGIEADGYEIDIEQLVDRPIKIAVRMPSTGTSTTSVSFLPTGQTTEVENVEVWLTVGQGARATSLPLNVTASTGLVTAGAVIKGQPPL